MYGLGNKVNHFFFLKLFYCCSSTVVCIYPRQSSPTQPSPPLPGFSHVFFMWHVTFGLKFITKSVKQRWVFLRKICSCFLVLNITSVSLEYLLTVSLLLKMWIIISLGKHIPGFVSPRNTRPLSSPSLVLCLLWAFLPHGVLSLNIHFSNYPHVRKAKSHLFHYWISYLHSKMRNLNV